MAPEQDKQLPDEKQAGGGEGIGAAVPAVPPALRHRPGISPGSVDITGIVPEGIWIDPDLTEGHPGYEESGASEIIPLERLAGGETGKQGCGTS
jgi:hypothetical protein